MDKKRREFLKIAGISTLAGLGAPAVVDRMVSGSFPLAAKAAQDVLMLVTLFTTFLILLTKRTRSSGSG